MDNKICPICQSKTLDWNLKGDYIWIECAEHGQVAMEYDKYYETTGIETEE